MKSARPRRGAAGTPRQNRRRANARQETDAEPGNGEHHALPQHHPQDIGAAGADRHADADLLRPPARRVRHQAVEPDDRQRQPHHAHGGDDADDHD